MRFSTSERFYEHLAPSYIADTVRAALGTTGLVPADNVLPLGTARSSG
jgi:hypothetical protein